jgi:hypothetical protein
MLISDQVPFFNILLRFDQVPFFNIVARCSQCA